MDGFAKEKQWEELLGFLLFLNYKCLLFAITPLLSIVNIRIVNIKTMLRESSKNIKLK